MRKKGIIFLLVIFAIFVVLYFIFTDRWLEHQMESVGSGIVGAKVEFDGVDFSFLDLHLRWNRLQVTDPNDTWHNLFETGFTDFNLDLEPLLAKKFVIEDLTVDSLKFNTKRETDGKLPEKAQEQSAVTRFIQKQIEKETAQMPVFNLGQYTRKVNVDSLWNLVDLRSPEKIDSLKTNYQQKFQDWEKRVSELPDEQDLNRLQQEIESIQPEQIKTVEAFQSALNKAQDIYGEVDSITANLKTVKSDFQQDVKQIDQSKSVISGWIQQDYRRVLNLAQIPDISVRNVAKLLFGRQILDRIENATGYVGTARYYMSKVKSGKPEKEKKPRQRGQDIFFSAKRSWPKFWVQNTSLTGTILNGLQISGTISNIVSDQNLIGKPTVVEIGGTRRDKASVKLTGSLDYTGDTPAEKFELGIRQMPLANVQLTDFALLPSRIARGKGDISARLNFEGSSFTSDIDFTASNVQFDFAALPENINPKIAELSRSIAQSINTIDLQATAKKSGEQFSFAINSNLDNLIAGRVKSLISGEVEQARQKLENRVRDEVATYRRQVEDLITAKEGEIRSRIEQVETEIQQRRRQLEAKKKELQERLDAQKKALQDKLGKEAKDKLKNLLK